MYLTYQVPSCFWSKRSPPEKGHKDGICWQACLNFQSGILGFRTFLSVFCLESVSIVDSHFILGGCFSNYILTSFCLGKHPGRATSSLVPRQRIWSSKHLKLPRPRQQLQRPVVVLPRQQLQRRWWRWGKIWCHGNRGAWNFYTFSNRKNKIVYNYVYIHIYASILLFSYYMRRLICFCCATSWFFRQLSWTGAGHCFSNVLEWSVTTGPPISVFLRSHCFCCRVFWPFLPSWLTSFPVINICDRKNPLNYSSQTLDLEVSLKTSFQGSQAS